MYIRVYLVNHFRKTIRFLTQVAEVHLLVQQVCGPSLVNTLKSVNPNGGLNKHDSTWS